LCYATVNYNNEFLNSSLPDLIVHASSVVYVLDFVVLLLLYWSNSYVFLCLFQMLKWVSRILVLFLDHIFIYV